MMTYSETLVADCESTWMNETQSTIKGSYTEAGTRISYDSKHSQTIWKESSLRHSPSTTPMPRTRTRKGFLMIRRQLTLLKFERSEGFDDRAKCAGRAEPLVRRRVHELDP